MEPPNPDRIREVTRDILSLPEFSEGSSWPEFIYWLLQAVRDWLNSVEPWSKSNPDLARVVVIVLVLLFLACLAHILYLTLGDLLFFGRKRESELSRGSRWEILQGTARDWREALATARSVLAEGNGRRAVWILHRILLGLLHEQGAIRFAGWKTNAHYLRECARNHPWYSTFAELTDLYEQAIYARRAAVPSAVEPLFLRVDQWCKETAR